MARPFRRNQRDERVLQAGEGRFHELLKIAGMTTGDFARLTGMHKSTIDGWQGFPTANWPLELLELIVWKQNASKLLTAKGWVPDEFRAGKLPIDRRGEYPRTEADAEALRLAKT